MAFNFQTFKTRALTALLFVAVMLTGLLWNFWSFLILFTIIHFGCWFEYLKLIEKIYDTKIDVVIKWLFVICGFTLLIVFGMPRYTFDMGVTIYAYEFSIKLLFWILLSGCLMVVLLQNKQIPDKAKRMGLLGLIYITLPILLILQLRKIGIIYKGESIFADFGLIIPCGIIFSIWINDTMAYLVGSFIGKTPLSKISPKKTIEGTLGGIILCVLSIGLLGKFVLNDSFKNWIIIAFLCSIFGTFGDLLESKLKRMADVKDSGNFMPGHGGFLDRFDSLLIAVPAVWIYVLLFIK